MDEIIDKFVNFLIEENCQGCTECEPRLDTDWFPNFACCEEGTAKWLLDCAERFKKKERINYGKNNGNTN